MTTVTGERLRSLRLAAGLSQRDVAAATNIARGYISDLERGREGRHAPVVRAHLEAALTSGDLAPLPKPERTVPKRHASRQTLWEQKEALRKHLLDAQEENERLRVENVVLRGRLCQAKSLLTRAAASL